MKDKGSNVYKAYCIVCDFTSNDKKVFEAHFDTDFHREGVMKRHETMKSLLK